MKKKSRRRRRNRQKKGIMELTDSNRDSISEDSKQKDEHLLNNVPVLDTTPVNKSKTLNRNILADNDTEYFCTNLNILFNNSDAASVVNTNVTTADDLHAEQSKLNNNKIHNNVESNLIVQNHRIFIHQADVLENYCEDYLQKPLYTSSPLYPAIKLNNEDSKVINNKAYKDELNLQRLKSFNDITIYATYKSPSQIKQNNIINVSNNLSEKSFDECKMLNSKLSLSRKKFNKSKMLSDHFLHNISVSIISRIKKFSAKYITKWIQNIISMCTWVGMLRSRKDSLNTNKTSEECRETIKCHCEQQQMNILITKIDKLISDVEFNRKQTTEHFLGLKARLDSLEENVNGYRKIQLELEEMKEKYVQKKNCAPSTDVPLPPPLPTPNVQEHVVINTTPPCPPSKAPPLPPPPPPLPPPASLLLKKNINNGLKITKVDKSETDKKDAYSRPVISEDALKQVKLRKVAERPIKSRRQTEPYISKEMLNQIKLKPVNSRPMSALQKDIAIDTDGCTVSPRSKFNRILQINSSITRVKRLRRNSSNFYDNSRSLRLMDRERV